ncbi:O-mannosyltransferase Ogm4 [Schizosaccharomyces japonicus yFS275]|uniref:Dolichyl-phosphate-mannose--protein mannosyltransferase n=1 Tax=Schizosaccharomyces japonicus (strain yFS275 / FY16936) TaxID=402676 RepID=B6JY32_SCHJY|nr:O-mannosyltransferase Ogm4 [Schizosaccharomyces japonicus yFS275]EEB06450.1 O-mannosyltransferase Ogm4 [Schizosaccharomyces japonicus yFS275]
MAAPTTKKGDTALRRRKNATQSPKSNLTASVREKKSELDETSAGETGKSSRNTFLYSKTCFRKALIAITVLSFLTRFWKIWDPAQVVFDEVHFGKFASYYIRGEYFFDLHPPFAKLMLALVAKLAGYDGHFLFDNIGDSYTENHVPYVFIRSFPAFLSSMVPPLVFLIMKESGYDVIASFTAAAIVLFDNAHITQGRLILLDAMLVFSMVSAIYCYIRFFKLRHRPFTRSWWAWLTMTGFCLSCTISTKYVGFFTFLSIGLSVVLELWKLWDVRTGLSVKEFLKHFYARAFTLIIFPFCLYLFWFYVHFSILKHSGPGDSLMSAEFQETLLDNPLLVQATPLNYYDVVLLKHKSTGAFLHSHPDRYPLRYEDGRVSSQGQQVTGYPYNDTNSYWMILPQDHYADGSKYTPGRPVMNMDVIKLHHISTKTDLMTHDVASPYYPTNEEFTTTSVEESASSKHNFTLFQIRYENDASARAVTTKSFPFRLVHQLTNVAMWSGPRPLPEWAHEQQEINGAKDLTKPDTIWTFDEIVDLKDPARLHKEQRVPKKISFLRKYIELQKQMFRQNNLLKDEHPYSSVPWQWPILHHGISFWANQSENKQIYLLGNPFGWWFMLICIFTLPIVAGILILAKQRGVSLMDQDVFLHVNRSALFFLVTWVFHYIPFFLMGRQLFLHHYLPAHIAGCFVVGALLQLACRKRFDLPISEGAKTANTSGKVHFRERRNGAAIELLISILIILALLYCFYQFYPAIYGTKSLSGNGWLGLKWRDTWLMHFQKPDAK